MKIMVINGPNLNFLGIREKHIYGSKSFEKIENYIKECSKSLGHDIEMLQSNIDSYAIYDAIKSVNIDTVEVHLSQIYDREDFRQKSVTAPACIGQICGFGEYGYIMAMNALENKMKISS